MGDACSRCSGRRWNWNGRERVPCRKCSAYLQGPLPDPGRDWYRIIPAAEWDAYALRLRSTSRR